MTLIVKSVELPGRVTLQYVERGETAGTPVIFLHGVTDSWRSFEPVLPHLPGSIRAFALSLRGHGDSSRTITRQERRQTEFHAAGQQVRRRVLCVELLSRRIITITFCRGLEG